MGPVLSVSIGVAVYPHDGERIETLLHAADAAMYAIKVGKHKPLDVGKQRRSNGRLLDGRIEKRLTMSVPVYLASLREPYAGERTVTENVSPYGARVWTKQPWHPEERVLLSSPETGLHAQARVVYSQRMKNKEFAVGLELSTPVEGWTKPH
jgi:hypothetical protein